MSKWIPREKLSKRARRELDKQQRQSWDFKPITRKVESAKRYDRKKTPRNRYDAFGAGRFLSAHAQYLDARLLAFVDMS